MIVAAGRGSRFGAPQPKQYLPLQGQTLLQLTVARLATSTYIEHCLLVISADDTRAQALEFGMPVSFTHGGIERWQSVAFGVDAIIEQGASDDDLILIHDAARPTVPTTDINQVIKASMSEPYGAILATPVADTLKQAQYQPMTHNRLNTASIVSIISNDIVDGIGADSVTDKLASDKTVNYYTESTLDRSHIWQSQTPQVFRLAHLRHVLDYVTEHHLSVTDEASAFEQLNLPIRLVAGSRQNIKLTYPDDALLITAIINMQNSQIIEC